MEKQPPVIAANFIRGIIQEDLKTGKNGGRVHTRFPPEPNGYLHIGHAKSICLNFGIAKEFNGLCNLRFDDTNPAKEDVEFIESIKRDVQWLGFSWDNRLYNASDYFEKLYNYGVDLIKSGKAYVCSLNAEQVREYRGTLTQPGRNSPYRDRSVAENLDLFDRMRKGEFPDGTHTLRAKIDMASPNINLRDPALYRIRHLHHPVTGDKWCVYPMYDYAHAISDALEGITHSLCTLEFEDHRPLYDWILKNLDVPSHPQQIEFSRLEVNYTVTSKRKLKELVDAKIVSGWDDPRMPTISGMRRRGYTPEALRQFCERIGISKSPNIIDLGLLEFCVREDLEKKAKRVLGVVNPIKLTITDYPEGKAETVEAPFHPQHPEFGTRNLTFTRDLYIEADDFMIEPPKDFFRLGPGREVRLRYGYIVKCIDYKTDPQTGAVTEIIATHDPSTLGKNPADGRKVKGIIHWVSAAHAVDAEVRLYDRLFNVPNPGAEDGDYKTHLNPASLTVAKAKIEASLATTQPGETFQFERLGYFTADTTDSVAGKPVFNRIVSLRDSWAKEKA